MQTLARNLWSTVALLAVALVAAPALAESPSTLAGRIVSVSGKVMIRKEAGTVAKDIRPAVPGKEVYVGDIITTPSDGRIKLLLQDRSLMDLGPSSLFKLDRMKLEKGSQRQVDSTVAYGTLRTGVTQKLEGKSHFKVRTSSATMGVRGTEFIVKSDIGDLKLLQKLANSSPGKLPQTGPAVSGSVGSNTEVTVLQGKVEVGTPALPTASESTAGMRAPAATAGTKVLEPGMQLIAGDRPGIEQDRRPTSAAPEVKQLDPQKLTELATTTRVPDKTFDQAVKISGATKDEENQQKREEKRSEQASLDRPTSSASPPQDRRLASTPESGALGSLTTIIADNLQTTSALSRTIRSTDMGVPGTIGAAAITSPDGVTQPKIHTLTIQFKAPAPD